MAQRTDFDWPVCEEVECIGKQLDTGMCLAHSNSEERAAALLLVGETGVVDFRGVPMTSELLQQVLAACPRRSGGKALLRKCEFDRATFTGDANFRGAAFTGDANFSGAAFTGDANFIAARFTGDANFSGAAFTGDANFMANFAGGVDFAEAIFTNDASFAGADFPHAATFNKTTFTRHANFTRTTFTSDADFIEATFTSDADFDLATFTRDANFYEATFNRAAHFVRTTFTRNGNFIRTTFQRAAYFHGATFTADADFGGASFEQARELGPILAYSLVLDGVQFKQPVQIQASTARLLCRQAQFPAGVHFRLRWAQVVLDDADFPAPSLLTGIPRLTSESLAVKEEEMARDWQQEFQREVPGQPQLLSLQRANVASLGLSNVNVAGCRFAGAHNLDKLRLEAGVTFEVSPTRLGRLGLGRREVIAEERAWRTARSRHWATPRWPPWMEEHPPEDLQPGQIAGLYRALRKGREDIKDEPGAADFYYGEMEMRRHSRPSPRDDRGGESPGMSRGPFGRGVLTVYWLVSGYGLRAWRAIACLAVVTAIFAIGFDLIGFTKPPQPVSYWTSLLYAFRATLSLSDNDVTLTAWGRLLQGLLRLTGPVLLGLAVLAVRGRVKR